MKLTVSSSKIFRIQIYCIISLTLLNAGVLLIGKLTGHGRMMGFGTLFNVGAELNIPTWYSSISLLLCSVLLGIIGAVRKVEKSPYTAHWKALSAGVLLLSIDEVAGIHERISHIWDNIVRTGPLSASGWTVPSAMILVVVGILFIKFLMNLPADTRRLFITAGALFFGGAIVLEAVGGIWRVAHSQGDLIYLLMMTVEECFGEMLGVAVFVYALHSYMAKHMKPIELTFGLTNVLDAETDSFPAQAKRTKKLKKRAQEQSSQA